ncbi:MAG: hypothetical protein Q4P14_00975 [Methanobacteriaceae archaeon]|nr:hypothetical protein [Methanobacteriaceae archaeon]
MFQRLKYDPEVEEFELENGKKIIRYIRESPMGGFSRASKYFGTFYEECIFDNDGNLISKKIKENPYYEPYESSNKNEI